MGVVIVMVGFAVFYFLHVSSEKFVGDRWTERFHKTLNEFREPSHCPHLPQSKGLA